MSAPCASVTEVRGNTRVATNRRKQKKGKRGRVRGGQNGREAGKGREGKERKVVTMRSRVRYGIVGDSGYRVPFLSDSWNEHKILRLFRQQASCERTGTVLQRAISLRASYPSNCAPTTFQISLSVLFSLLASPRPASRTLDRLHRHGQRCTFWPSNLSSYFSHYFSDPVFLYRLPFSSCLFRALSATSLSRKLFDFPLCSARDRACTRARPGIYRTKRWPERARTPSPVPGMFLHLGMNRPIQAAFSTTPSPRSIGKGILRKSRGRIV